MFSGFFTGKIPRIKNKRNNKTKKKGEILKTGSQIKSNQAVVFTSLQSMAALMSSPKGRFILQPEPSVSNEDTYIELMVSEVLKRVDTKKKHTSSRAELLNSVVELEQFFKNRQILAFEGTTKLNISNKAFPMDETTFFYLIYNYDEENIPKQLDSSGDTLIFKA